MSTPVEVLELDILLIQADNLAAKDHNLLGRPTTSDPYCEVRFLPQGERSRSTYGGDDRVIFMGKTPPILKTLAPKWGMSFQATVPANRVTDEAFVEVTIVDYDTFGDDDPMGVIQVNIDIRQLGTKTKWYGVPAMSAGGESATGRVQCTLTTKRGVKMPEKSDGSEAAEVSESSHNNSNDDDDDDNDDDGPVIQRKSGSANRSVLRDRGDRGGRRGGGRRASTDVPTAEQRRQSRREGGIRKNEESSAKEETPGNGRPRSRIRRVRSNNEESTGGDSAREQRDRDRGRSDRNHRREPRPSSSKAATGTDRAKRPSSKHGIRKTLSRNEEDDREERRPTGGDHRSNGARSRSKNAVSRRPKE